MSNSDEDIRDSERDYEEMKEDIRHELRKLDLEQLWLRERMEKIDERREHLWRIIGYD